MTPPALASTAEHRSAPVAPVTVDRTRSRAALRLGLGAAACLFALAVVWHTLAFLAAHRPALPLYDG